MIINISNELARGSFYFTSVSQFRLVFACMGAVEFEGFYEKHNNLDYCFEISKYRIQQVLGNIAKRSINGLLTDETLLEIKNSNFFIKNKLVNNDKSVVKNKSVFIGVFDSLTYEEVVYGKNSKVVLKYRFAREFAERHFFVKEYYALNGEMPKGVSGYTELDTEIISSISNIYACNLYIKAATTKNEGMHAYRVYISDIKDKMGYYDDYKQFKKKIIKGLQKTLEKFNYKLDFVEVKKGRKVDAIDIKMSTIKVLDNVKVSPSENYNNRDIVRLNTESFNKAIATTETYSNYVMKESEMKGLMKAAKGDMELVKKALNVAVRSKYVVNNLAGYAYTVIEDALDTMSLCDNTKSLKVTNLTNQQQRVYDYLVTVYDSVTPKDIIVIKEMCKTYNASTIKKAIQKCCIENKKQDLSYVYKELKTNRFGKPKVSRKKSV